jgi:hypothetical protein
MRAKKGNKGKKGTRALKNIPKGLFGAQTHHHENK